MRSRTVIIICFLLLPVILAGYAVLSHYDKKAGVSTTAATGQLVFRHKEQEKEIGAAQAFTDNKENYVYNVQYPVTGNPAVDGQIKAAAEKIAEDFAAVVKSYKSASDAYKAVMTADYKAYIETDSKTYSYLSVVFEAAVNVPGTETHGKKIKTMFFDQNTGKQLKLEDVFAGDYIGLISNKVIAYFKSSETYGALTKETLFKENTAPKAENFLNFAVINKDAVFYFDSLRLFSEKFGCPAASVPLDELYKVLKVKMTEKEVYVPDGSGGKLLAITFDDGPRPSVTNRILDALEKAGGRVTFFSAGYMIDGKVSNDAVLRAYNMGCEIANHSFSHKKFTKSLSMKELRYQVDETNRIVEKITGESPKLFRLPYGYANPEVIKNVHMPLIGWSMDPKDWSYSEINKPNRTQAQWNADKMKVADNILNAAKDGDIVIMHDIYKFSADVCEAVFPELVKRGFKLVTVSEMFEARGITMRDGVVYKNARK